MPIRSLFSALVLCSGAYGCATLPNEPAAPQSKSDPVVRTGTRIPTNDPAAMSPARQISRDDWMNDRRSVEGKGRTQ